MIQTLDALLLAQELEKLSEHQRQAILTVIGAIKGQEEHADNILGGSHPRGI